MSKKNKGNNYWEYDMINVDNQKNGMLKDVFSMVDGGYGKSKKKNNDSGKSMSRFFDNEVVESLGDEPDNDRDNEDEREYERKHYPQPEAPVVRKEKKQKKEWKKSEYEERQPKHNGRYSAEEVLAVVEAQQFPMDDEDDYQETSSTEDPRYAYQQLEQYAYRDAVQIPVPQVEMESENVTVTKEVTVKEVVVETTNSAPVVNDEINTVRITYDANFERFTTTDGVLISNMYVPNYINMDEIDEEEIDADMVMDLLHDMMCVYVLRTHPACIIKESVFIEKMRSLGIIAMDTDKFICARRVLEGENYVMMYYCPDESYAVYYDTINTFGDQDAALRITRNMMNTRDGANNAFPFEEDLYVERYTGSFDQIAASNKLFNVICNDSDTRRQPGSQNLTYKQIAEGVAEILDIEEFYRQTLASILEVSLCSDFSDFDDVSDMDTLAAVLGQLAENEQVDEDDEEELTAEEIAARKENCSAMISQMESMGIKVVPASKEEEEEDTEDAEKAAALEILDNVTTGIQTTVESTTVQTTVQTATEVQTETTASPMVVPVVR